MIAAAPSDFKLLPNHALTRLGRPALIAGAAAVVLAALGAFLSPTQFLHSYLVAYMFWCGLALGSMAILMLHYITGGVWGVMIRRPLEAATRTVPLLALLFVPLALGVHELYEWADSAHLAQDPALQAKAFYLNVPFFLGRTVIYFGVWLILARTLNRWSLEQDVDYSPALSRRLQYLGRGGLLLYSLTMTFAAIDWVMSLEPHWYSTIYGILIIGGQVLNAFAFVIVVLAALAEAPPMQGVIPTTTFHDLGKLMLAFIMLWGYFSFSQFLIIWSGNLPEEIPWYVSRLNGGWQVLGVGLILVHFALPFALLLSRSRKQNYRRLRWVALLMMVMRFVDLYWTITPAFSPRQFHVHWLDVVSFVAVGGLWLAMFSHQLQQRPLLATKDPELA